MNKLSVSLAVLVIVFGFSTEALALIVYNDGGTHQIDWASNEYIEVENNFWGDSTTFNLAENGEIITLQTYENSHVNIYDGRINDYFLTFDQSTVNISGGFVQTLVPSGNGQVLISGGVISDIAAYSQSMIEIEGGYLGSLLIYEGSHVVVSGGLIGNYIDIEENAGVTIKGGYFELDGHSVFGEVINQFNEDKFVHISGVYFDDSPADFFVNMSPNSSVTFTPEPSTILLLSLGCFLARGKKINRSGNNY